MLVITRKEGEALEISPAPDIGPEMTVGELFSQPITIRLEHTSGKGQVKVCIEAPLSLSVTREEL